MSKYKELQTAVTKLETASSNYWSQLEEIYQQIPGAFLDFLGTETQTVEDLNHNQIPLILLGNFEYGEVVRTPVRLLEKDDKALVFSLRIALCDQYNLAKVFMVFHIKMSRGLNNVFFHITDWDEPVVCRRDDETFNVDFTPLFESMYERITRNLSPMKYL